MHCNHHNNTQWCISKHMSKCTIVVPAFASTLVLQNYTLEVEDAALLAKFAAGDMIAITSLTVYSWALSINLNCLHHFSYPLRVSPVQQKLWPLQEGLTIIIFGCSLPSSVEQLAQAVVMVHGLTAWSSVEENSH